MRGPSRVKVALYAVLVVVFGLIGNVATGLVDVPDAARPWVLGGAGALAVVSVLVEVLQHNGDGQPVDGPDAMAVLESFARSVTAQWRREEDIRRVQDPFPMPVTWRPAPAALADHPANVRRLPPGADAEPLDLPGDLGGIVDAYTRIPSGRLVVLGRAGAGKTVLAVRFVLDSLGHRPAGAPVPVVFRLNAWNVGTGSLRDWLVGQLVADYPALAAPVAGRDGGVAGVAVDDGHVLPVLDGLDEVAAGARPDVIRAVNATTLPCILTSRYAEYAEAVAASDVVTAAAVLELADLTVADLRAYLPRTTRFLADGPPRTTRWSAVLDRLDSPGAAGLRAVLATPLMVALARTVYSDNPAADPAELLDTGRFATRQSLEDHLLDSFVPEVYGPHTGSRWTVDEARRWLGHLAGHLSATGGRDLAWWDLRDAVRPWVRVAAFAGVGAVGGGLCLYPVWPFGAGAGMGFTLIPALWRHGRQPIRSPLRLRGRGARTLLLLVVSALAGLLGGVAGGAVSRRTGALVLDAFVGRSTVVGLDTAWGWPLGVAAGLLLSAASAFNLEGTGASRPPGATRTMARGAALAFLGAVVCGIGLGTVGGLAIGLTAGPMAALVADFETVMDPRVATSPQASLRIDSRNSRVQRLLIGSCLGFSFFAAAAGPGGWVTALTLGVGIALVAGVGNGLVGTASGQWTLTRAILGLAGRTPFPLLRFLEDAHARGVLRQAGAVFQFRHHRLQERLALPDPGGRTGGALTGGSADGGPVTGSGAPPAHAEG